MKLKSLIFLGSIVTMYTLQAQATSVTVKGVITPPACNATFESPDLILDWGNIPHSELNETTTKILPKKTATLQVTCEPGTSTRVAFWAKNAGPGIALPGQQIELGINGSDPNRIFSLGMDPVTNASIGNFVMMPTKSTYGSETNDSNFGFVQDAGHTAISFVPALFSSKWGITSNGSQDFTILNKDDGKVAEAANFTFSFDVVPQLNLKQNITNAMEVPFVGTAQFYVRYF
ncbi:hypothetical protein ACISK3_11885 [Morganella morganii]|nr:DUF1120 domain-containing protein [Morganella morganii]